MGGAGGVGGVGGAGGVGGVGGAGGESEVQATAGSITRSTAVARPYSDRATADRFGGAARGDSPWRIDRPVRGNRSAGRVEVLLGPQQWPRQSRADEMEWGAAAVDKDWGIRAAAVGLEIEQAGTGGARIA